MTDKSPTVDFLAGFIVGALAGAAAAFLFAPQSGEETRALIRDKSTELQEQAGQISAQGKEQAAKWQEKIKYSFDEGMATAKGSFAPSKEEIAPPIEEIVVEEVTIDELAES